MCIKYTSSSFVIYILGYTIKLEFCEKRQTKNKLRLFLLSIIYLLPLILIVFFFFFLILVNFYHRLLTFKIILHTV